MWTLGDTAYSFILNSIDFIAIIRITGRHLLNLAVDLIARLID